MIYKFRIDKKFFVLILLIFLLILSGIFSPLLIKKYKDNWEYELTDKIKESKKIIQKSFNQKVKTLIQESSRLKKKILSHKKEPFDLLITLHDEKDYPFIIQLLDENMKLVYWNSQRAEPRKDLMDENHFLNQVHFYQGNLLVYLSIVDTIKIKKAKYYLFVDLPIEKKYKLKRGSSKYLSWSDSLSQILNTTVEIKYNPNAQLSRDGRFYSFILFNNSYNKIGVVNLEKPAIDSILNELNELFKSIQFVILLLIYFNLVWISIPYLKQIHKKGYRFIFYLISGAVLRLLLFYSGFPSSYLRNSLTDASNFSSTFAFGIVRSPLEFTITAVIGMFIILIGFIYTLDYFDSQKDKRKNWLIFTLVTLISFLLLLLSLRGLGASLRSVIFDSSIRYFKEFKLIPDAPTLLMDFNILVLGMSVIIFSLILLLFVFSFNPLKNNLQSFRLFAVLFFVLQFFGWIFDAVQKQPQGTPIIRMLYILIIFGLAYILIFKSYRSIIKYVYISFGASIATVSLLTYYNSEIEKESLKTTAQELTRSNQSIYQFMVYQTLSTIENEKEVQNAILENKNLSSLAFIEWTKSLLYNETVLAFINFYDSQRKLIGNFSTSIFNSTIFKGKLNNNFSTESLEINIIPEIFGQGKIIRGIAPLKDNNSIIGYAEVGVLFDESNFGFANVPKYFLAERTGMSSAINLERIKIFYFLDKKLVKSFGALNLTESDIKNFVNAPFTKYKEAWLNLNLGGEKHLFYVLKLDKSKILAVGKEEKNYTWNLSDFFKVFFIHTLIILAVIIIVSLWNYSKLISFLQSYRTKLAAAFVMVSIIPLIVFAIYFKNITETKNTELISKRLSELARQIDNYLRVYNLKTSVKPEFIYAKASEDLNIKFSVFKDKVLEYSTSQNLYDVGLLSKIISPIAYADLLQKGSDKSFLISDFEIQNYNSVYLKSSFNNEQRFIEVNDLLNEVLIPLSDVELDIVMFGIFSLAVIMIIIFSTLLANQISLPIRKLTLATRSVGSGDLNVEVSGNYSGEIAELTLGFNMMVQKLKKSQLEMAQLERETAWKEMAKQVAHEIKNPLTPMKLSIQQLIAAYYDKSPKFDEIFNKVTSTIINQIETLKNIASEFSNFARMPKLNIEKINLVDVIKESLNLFTDEKLFIKFIFDKKEIIINADYDHLNRTIINLIRNSIQANAKNITINVLVENNYCLLRIADDGIGIPVENIDKIFDENFTTKKQGMGLGLSMAKKFFESINSSITVENTSENGTTFLIKIPLAE